MHCLPQHRGGRASKSSGIERARACGFPQSSGIERARALDGRAHSSSSEYRASHLKKINILYYIRNHFSLINSIAAHYCSLRLYVNNFSGAALILLM